MSDTPVYDEMVATHGFDPLDDDAEAPAYPAEDLDAAPEAAATGSGAADPPDAD